MWAARRRAMLPLMLLAGTSDAVLPATRFVGLGIIIIMVIEVITP